MKFVIILLIVSSTAMASSISVEDLQKENVKNFGIRFYGDVKKSKKYSRHIASTEDPSAYYKRTGERMSVEDYNEYLKNRKF